MGTHDLSSFDHLPCRACGTDLELDADAELGLCKRCAPEYEKPGSVEPSKPDMKSQDRASWEHDEATRLEKL